METDTSTSKSSDAKIRANAQHWVWRQARPAAWQGLKIVAAMLPGVLNSYFHSGPAPSPGRYAPLVTNNTYIKFHVPSNLSIDEKTRNRKREKILQAILFVIPNANPSSGKLIGDVTEWWLEIDLTDKLPIREIGIGNKGQTLLINPWGRDLGLWTDEEVTLDYFQEHFNAVHLEKEEFEKRWAEFAINHSYK